MTHGLSLQWKLTGWYIAALAIIILIFAGLMCAMMGRQLNRRIDTELREEAKELAEEIETRSAEEIRSIFARHYAEHGGFSFQILRADGTVLCGSPWLYAHTLPMAESTSDATSESFADITLANAGRHRLIRHSVISSFEPLVINVLVPYAQSQREFFDFLNVLVVAGCVSLLVACGGGLMIARRALDPLERIITTAERISSENLNTSIAIENPSDELGRLSKTLNSMFDRLRDSVNRMQRFTADVAHELRTPLTVLRTRLDVAFRTPLDPDQFCVSYRIAIEQADALTRLIDQLLILSRQDAGTAKSQFDEVTLRPLLHDVADVLRTAASAKGVSLTVGDVPDCIVSGDDISLSRLFFNLIDNAIKYTPAGGRVQLAGLIDGAHVRLIVSDTGIGIALDQLSKLFDRFYRVDPSRNGQTGGAGLGLAICRSIVESHEGEISVSSIVGQGSTFTVVLPLKADRISNEGFMEELNVQSHGIHAGQLH